MVAFVVAAVLCALVVVSGGQTDTVWANSSEPQSCRKDGECSGSSLDNCCSKGKGHGTLRCGIKMCDSCEKVMKSVIWKLAKESCKAIIPEESALCEAVGLGPEDPLADMCALAVATGCPIAAEYIAKKEHADPKHICEKFHLCGTDGQRCGKLKDGKCTDSTHDCESGHSHHTGRCITNLRCGCLKDGECATSHKDCCSRTDHHTARCAGNVRCGKGVAVDGEPTFTV